MRIILGGTVYHDLGNLNCTFFTRRSKYDRRRNLNIICNAIGNVTDLNVAVNDREDIVLGHLGRDLKISGTAAKLGKDSAYHHCTVLVDVNECVLHDALHSKAVRIENTLVLFLFFPLQFHEKNCENFKAPKNSLKLFVIIIALHFRMESKVAPPKVCVYP